MLPAPSLTAILSAGGQETKTGYPCLCVHGVRLEASLAVGVLKLALFVFSKIFSCLPRELGEKEQKYVTLFVVVMGFN